MNRVSELMLANAFERNQSIFWESCSLQQILSVWISKDMMGLQVIFILIVILYQWHIIHQELFNC